MRTTAAALFGIAMLGACGDNIGITPVPLVSGPAEIAGVSLPAREVGGDFFNYFLLPDGRMALLVGDVSGKGVSASLLMASCRAAAAKPRRSARMRLRGSNRAGRRSAPSLPRAAGRGCAVRR